MINEAAVSVHGNLTAAPELRTTGTGKQVAGFTIASTPRAYNRQSKQWEDGQTVFLRCTAWEGLAEHIAASLDKGSAVLATGRLSQRSYTTKDGTERTVIEMTVDDLGPSLLRSTVQVIRAHSDPGFQGAGNGCGFGSDDGQPQF